MWKQIWKLATVLLVTAGGSAQAASLSDRSTLASDTVGSSAKQVASDDTARSHVPANYSVSQNYPNPFNAVTTIEYSLPQQSGVFITIYNLSGQCVAVIKNDIEDAGYHRASWDGTNAWGAAVASGMYIFRIVADDYYAYRKMVVLK